MENMKAYSHNRDTNIVILLYFWVVLISCNPVFSFVLQKKRPLVHAKLAKTLHNNVLVFPRKKKTHSVFCPFLKTFKSEFLIQVLISRLIVNKNVIIF